MPRPFARNTVAAFVLALLSVPLLGAEPEKKARAPAVEITGKEDVIYARHGRVHPKKANGRGVIFRVSAGWVSDKVIGRDILDGCWASRANDHEQLESNVRRSSTGPSTPPPTRSRPWNS